MKLLINRFSSLTKNNKGQGLVEYSLLLILIAVVVILSLKMFGGEANNTYKDIGSAVIIAR